MKNVTRSFIFFVLTACISLASSTASADVTKIQSLLTLMDCKPGAVDGVWGQGSQSAYENLMRNTKQPILTCMTDCIDTVLEKLLALQSDGASCKQTAVTKQQRESVNNNLTGNWVMDWEFEFDSIEKDEVLDISFIQEGLSVVGFHKDSMGTNCEVEGGVGDSPNKWYNESDIEVRVGCHGRNFSLYGEFTSANKVEGDITWGFHQGTFEMTRNGD